MFPSKSQTTTGKPLYGSVEKGSTITKTRDTLFGGVEQCLTLAKTRDTPILLNRVYSSRVPLTL